MLKIPVMMGKAVIREAFKKYGIIWEFNLIIAPYRFFAIFVFRCSLPKAMSISRSEILRKKAEETKVEKLPLVNILESVS